MRKVTKKKYKYCVQINGAINKKKPYICSYSKTNNIEVYLKKNSLSIVFEYSKDYSSQNALDKYVNTLIRKVIEKAEIIYILKYKEVLKISSVSICITSPNGHVRTVEANKFAHIYSLIQGKMLDADFRPFDENKLQSIMSIRQSDDDLRMAMISSYISSKFTMYEYEKFNHNWIAFNAMYAYVATVVCPIKGTSEQDRMSNLCSCYGLGSMCSGAKTRQPLCKEVVDEILLARSKGGLFNILTQDNDENPIKRLFTNDRRMDTFFITDFSYYLRCKHFHGEKPIPLFAYENDFNLLLFQVANYYLGRFLDEKVLEMF